MRVYQKNVGLVKGLSILETLICVSIVGIVGAVAVRNYNNVEKQSQATACTLNLQRIAGAKAVWASELKKASSETPVPSDLAPYLSTHALPDCPTSGSYTINRLDQNPTCSQAAYGHTY